MSSTQHMSCSNDGPAAVHAVVLQDGHRPGKGVRFSAPSPHYAHRQNLVRMLATFWTKFLLDRDEAGNHDLINALLQNEFARKSIVMCHWKIVTEFITCLVPTLGIQTTNYLAWCLLYNSTCKYHVKFKIGIPTRIKNHQIFFTKRMKEILSSSPYYPNFLDLKLSHSITISEIFYIYWSLITYFYFVSNMWSYEYIEKRHIGPFWLF